VAPELFRVDDSIRQVQTEKLQLLRSRRNNEMAETILQRLENAAHTTENLMPIVVEAVENYCTLGEIADTLRKVWGEHR
jgi:methylmalonyl-CoA mutase N-terminal domain/subunit